MSLVVHRRLVAGLLAVTLGCLLAVAGAAAPPAGAAVPLNASDQRLAEEFLRLLQAKDTAGLRAFLAPSFLIQRADGTSLTRDQYLRNPAVVNGFTVTDVFGTRRGRVRVIRYTVVTDQLIDGQRVSQAPVPRLSTYVRAGKTWRLIAHANFNAPAPAPS